MSAMNKVVDIKPYSISELSNLYGVSRRTMRNWIAPHQPLIGDKIGHLYTALQVKVIFERLGLPGKAEE